MHVAVIIPAFNVARYLPDAILSVIFQTHPDWSLVVVDDGSTDATAEVMEANRHPRIQFVRQENGGVSAARNTGIGTALGRFGTDPDAFLFLDGDDWLAPNAIAQLVSALQAAPWAAAASGRYARVAMDGSTHRSATPPEGRLLERILTGNVFVNGGHLLLRREAIVRAGNFRTDLRYGEDWEYWVRVAASGSFVAVRSPAPLLFVRERAGSAYHDGGADPHAYEPAMRAIFGNPEIIRRIGHARLAALARRNEAEKAWAVGRELIRHGRMREGQVWLRRSVQAAPSLKRMLMIGFSRLRIGPFRPYQTVG